MNNRSVHLCPVEKSGGLDSRIRRWLQNPQKILRPYISEGMTVMDLGCGPGFFTIDMALMVGGSGRVIAVDYQEGMLQKLREKIQNTELEKRITLHKCEEGKIGVSEEVDLVLAFYVMHEIPDQKGVLKELGTILKPGGKLFLVEPPLHVSKKDFAETLQAAESAGFVVVENPRMFLNKTAFLKLESG